MRITPRQGEQRTLIIEGFSVAEFLVSDIIEIDEERNTLTFNLGHGSQITNVVRSMINLPRLFDIIILFGIRGSISFKKCAFVTQTSVPHQFSLKFIEIIWRESMAPF